MSFYSEFAEHYERVFPLRDAVVAYLCAHLPAPPARILDAGCGPGHHCGRLAEAGYRAVGVDLDAAMIDAARAAHPGAEFHVLDLADAARLPGDLDGAFCLGNVAPHLVPEALAGVLDALRAKLPAGAPWLVQTVNWDPVLELDSYRFPDRDLDGVVFRREYAGITDRRLLFRTELLENGRTVFTGEDVMHPLRAADFVALHADHGFELVAHHADFAGAPYDPERPGGSVTAFRVAG